MSTANSLPTEDRVALIEIAARAAQITINKKQIRFLLEINWALSVEGDIGLKDVAKIELEIFKEFKI